MTKKRKPETKQELEQDIQAHPERGKINGKPVVDDGRRQIRGTVPAELKRKFLRFLACYGLDNTAGLEQAIALLWKEHREVIESHERQKSEELGVSVAEIQKKSYGHIKARGRQKRLNLTGEGEKPNAVIYESGAEG
jgi:hypothetical protein